MQDSNRSVSLSAVHFLSGTFLSRCSGMLRDLSMAFCFGSSPAVASFMVAYRFANLLRRLCGEGALSAAFIPHFEGLRAECPHKGTKFFRDLFFSLTLFLIITIVLIELCLFGLVKWNVLTPGGTHIVILSMLMLPGVLFASLFGLTSALLHCDKRFFISGVAPVAFNLVWIGAVWWLKRWDVAEAMVGLAGFVIVAFATQWLVTMQGQWHFLLRSMKVTFFSSDTRVVAKSLLLTLFGVGAVQINSALDGVFARFASLEGPAYLWYAIRLEHLPIALCGVALSAALLPPLSRAVKAGEWEKHRELLSHGLERSVSLMLPCTIAIFTLGCVGVNLLYGRGDFSQIATSETVMCLWGYSLGLVPTVFVILIAPSFYARSDYKTPAQAAVLAVLVNIILNSVFVFLFKWGAFSIAIATASGSIVNLWYLAKKQESIWTRSLGRCIAKVAFISCVAGAMTLLAAYFLNDPIWSLLLGEPVVFSRHFGKQLLECGILTTIFGGTLWVIARLFRIRLL